MSSVLRKTICFSILSVTAVAQGAEFKLLPSIAVSEEFTDNVFETNTNRTSDYITHAMPGIAASYTAPALNGDLNYVFDYQHYAMKNHEDDIAHSLNAKGHLTAVENFMYLDVSDEYQRVSLDVTRDVTKESLFVNQLDRNVVTAAPYLIFYPTERLSVRPGYRFIDTRYFGSDSIGIGVDKTEHVASLDMAYELSKRFSLTGSYKFTREMTVIDNFNQHLGLGGFRYEYADKSFVFAQAGNSWTRYDSGRRLNSFIWNAGMTHVFDTVTATITTGVKYDEDPLSNIVKESFVNGILEKRFQRGTLSFSPYYSEYVLTEKTKKYGAIVQGNYEIFSDLNGRLAFTAEKYKQSQFESNIRRFQIDSGLSYLLASQLTASLSYIYVEYYSPDSATDNRHVNRGMIEIKKTF